MVSIRMTVAWRWIVALLCVVAAGLSLWLSIEKWAGRIDSLAGCGAGSGCANVLGSRWSVVFGEIPVSAFSFSLYIFVLFSLGVRAEAARWFRALAAWLCIWAALWFTGLQIFVLHTICPYCMTMHGVGSLLGGAILLGEKGGGIKKGLLVSMMAAVGVAGLALIQYFGPDPPTHRVDVLNTGGIITDSGLDGEPEDRHAQGVGRKIVFLDGAKSYNIDELPHLGSADAEHVVVEYFDYTCEACRDMHGYLERAVTRRPKKLAVIVLPIPLHRDCNQNLPKGLDDHENACELARLALKVWRADPSLFAEFHRNLFENQGIPIEVAESLAVGLVGEEKMSNDHHVWVEAVLAQNVADYQWLTQTTHVMPKLLLKESVIVQGLMKDQAAFDGLLNEHLGVK